MIKNKSGQLSGATKTEHRRILFPEGGIVAEIKNEERLEIGREIYDGEVI